MMHSVLVLEDDSLLRTSMTRVLTDIPDTEVESAGTLHEALDVVRRREPDLVVADLELPDGSGLELLHALGESGVPFVFVSGYIPNYVEQLQQHPHVQVREKPMPMHELQTLVLAQLEASKLEAPSPFGAADYVQLACMGRHSVRIEIEHPAVRGRIYIEQGRIWAAHTETQEGTQAFFALLFVSGGAIRCSQTHHVSVSRNISEESWEMLMLEAARLRDEAER